MKKFKKVLCGILSATLVASYCEISDFSNDISNTVVVKADTTLRGDINNDGVLTALDIMQFKQYMVGKIQLDSDVLLRADMNVDNIVNIVDGILLINEFLNPSVPEPEQTTTTTPPVTDDNQGGIDEVKEILLDGNSITTTGSGTEVSGSVVTITEPGEYIVKGKLNDGQIIVSVDKTAYPAGKVELSLQGADISSSSDSPIYVESVDDECVISVKKGTDNVISDGKSYTNADEDSGAIYSKDDLKIKGKGNLTVNGNCADGIVGKDSVKIFNGNITVNAVDDGIRGKDSVKIGDADDTDFSALNVTVVSSGGDGITSTNDTDADKGNVIINGGTINITAYADGIQSEHNFTMDNGELTIKTTATGSSSWGGTTTDVSSKGIKASNGNLTINGGTVNIDSSDDGLHCSGDMNVLGGNITIASGDDGMHSDTNLNIGTQGATELSTPDINITKSYEGVEGVTINMNSGTIHITASDDGYNAAGGNDGSGNTSPGGWGGGFGGGMSSSSGTLNINGGYTFMQAKGDGLDANGACNLNGGTVVINGFTSGDTSPLDADSGVNYKGGTVLGYGSSNMAVTPSSYSFITTSASISSGTRVTFTDASGNILSTVTVPQGSAGRYLFYCSPQSSVTCYTGGTVSGTAMWDDYYGEGGTISGGTTLAAGSAGGGNGGFRPW